MCVIISAPAGKHVKQRYLKNSWDANDDGAGIMFTHDKKVHIIKGLMTFKDFIEAWKEIPENLPRVAHFRIGTHGKPGPQNTHPFEVVPGRLAVVHNGILDIKPVGEMSDTATFVDLILKRLPWGWHRSPAHLFILDGYCGSGNKLAILDETGKVTLVNETAGTWDEGVWYSNYSFRGYQSRGGYVGTGGWARGDDGDWEALPATYPLTTVTPTTTPHDGADTDATRVDDEILDSTLRESGLRRQACTARTAGKTVEAEQLEERAARLAAYRVDLIREAERARTAGLIVSSVKNLSTGTGRKPDENGDYRNTPHSYPGRGGD